MTTTKRRGLRESLEDYARRLNVRADELRASWRVQGLILLGAQTDAAGDVADLIADCAVSRVRVCPAASVPCGPEPADVIELEYNFDAGGAAWQVFNDLVELKIQEPKRKGK